MKKWSRIMFNSFEAEFGHYENEFESLTQAIRDEVLITLNIRGPRNSQVEAVFRQRIQENINGIVNRAETMACKLEKAQVNGIPTYRYLLTMFL